MILLEEGHYRVPDGHKIDVVNGWEEHQACWRTGVCQECVDLGKSEEDFDICKDGCVRGKAVIEIFIMKK